MRNCPFCRVIRGEEDAVFLWRSAQVVAILHQAPICAGHTLILPHDHHNSLTTVPVSVRAAMMTLAPVLGQALVREMKGNGFNLHLANGACAGQAYPHSCMHVIPRDAADGFAWNWRSLPYDEEQAKQLQAGMVKRLPGAGEKLT